jgi:hypothetical protein
MDLSRPESRGAVTRADLDHERMTIEEAAVCRLGAGQREIGPNVQRHGVRVLMAFGRSG